MVNVKITIWPEDVKHVYDVYTGRKLRTADAEEILTDIEDDLVDAMFRAAQDFISGYVEELADKETYGDESE